LQKQNNTFNGRLTFCGSICHSSDGWYWTVSGWNDCYRSHNSWHSSDGWYWTLSGWNDCRPRSHNNWHWTISIAKTKQHI
jgi:hypothetical protein